MTCGLGGGDTSLPAGFADLDPSFFIDLLKKFLGPEYKEMERTYGKDVLGGIRKMVASGEIPDLPRDLIEFLDSAAYPAAKNPRRPSSPRPGPSRRRAGAAGPARGPTTIIPAANWTSSRCAIPT